MDYQRDGDGSHGVPRPQRSVPVLLRAHVRGTQSFRTMAKALLEELAAGQ